MLPNINTQTSATTDFISKTVTATTTGFLSIPADRYFSFDVMISGSQAGAGTATPHVTLNNTANGSPYTSGSGIVAQLSITSLVGVNASSTGTIEVVGYAGDTGATLDFNLGGATATCTVNGFIL